MKLEHIVIVGAGQAGATAILALRAQDYAGRITLIGDEKHTPYERPPLSKDAILNPEKVQLEILSRDKLAALNVDFIAEQAAVKLDADAHTVQLSDGRSIAYDKLLLATGGSARRLANLDALGQQVYTLRNLEDAQALIPVLQPGRRIVLIGGGVIGLELASSAREKGCDVKVLELGERLMGRTTPAILAEFLLSRHRHQDVDIRLNTQVTQAELKEGQVHLTLNHTETLLADAVVYGIGIVPNSQLAVDAGLAVSEMGAIQVNRHCQSSHPDIYAAGDVATQLTECGQYRRIETWENANVQATTFAQHVMQAQIAAEQPAWFWTDQVGVNFQFAGELSAEEWFIRGDINYADPKPAFILFGVNAGKVVAGITVNMARDMRFIKKMLQQRQDFSAQTHLDLTLPLKSLV